MPLAIHILAFVLGAVLALATLYSATCVFVVPRAVTDRIARTTFLTVRRTFDVVIARENRFHRRDAIMALYAPVSLLVLLNVWLALVLIGFMGVFWGLGAPAWRDAFYISGSSLLTLGFASTSGLPMTVSAFVEAAIGLVLVALLIAYLPTIYSAFSRREALVSLLEVRAGSPPSPVTMYQRFHRLRGIEKVNELWAQWEHWFTDVDETHTSLAALAFFRSPRSDRHWVTAAGTVLDAAALHTAALDVPHDVQADLCIRAGFLALRHIAELYHIPYNPNPKPDDPISVTREEFDAVCDELAAYGIPIKLDRDQAWRDYAGWRVNYDTPLLALAHLTMAPEVPWISDAPRMRWVAIHRVHAKRKG